MIFFYCAGLLINVDKTVRMAYQPCRALGCHYTEAFILRITGKGQTYQDRLRQIFRCPDCNVYLTVGSLAPHRHSHNGVAQGYLKYPPVPPPPGRGQDLPNLTDSLTTIITWHCLTGGGVPREGNDPQRTPGTLRGGTR